MEISNEMKSVKAGLIFILIVIIGIGIVTYREVNQVFEASAKRENSYQILSNLKELRSMTALAEEAQRSYIITGEEKYLDPLTSASQNVDDKFDQLKKMIENPIQLSRVDSLEELVYFRLESLNEKVKAQKKGLIDKAVENILSGSGKRYMLKIRELIVTMEEFEYNLLKERDKEVISTVKSTSITILVGTFVSSIIFLSVFFLLSKEITERKKVEKEIRKEKDFSDHLLNSSIDGILAFDNKCRFILWNPGMEQITGLIKSEVIGKNIFNTFPILKNLGEEENVKKTLNGETTMVKDRFFFIPKTKRKGYIEANYSPIRDLSKNVIGGLVIIRNRTQRKLAEEELRRTKINLEKRVEERTAELSKANVELKKEIEQRKKTEEQMNSSLNEKVILLREIHHRVKNNLQVISSLLNLQSGYIEDEKAKEIFHDSQNRVRSMALIHEKLYQSKTLSKIEFSDYINSLVRELFSSYNIDTNKVKLISDIEGIFLGIDTGILCGLIINELVSNSLKHAFPEGKNGEIFISINNSTDNVYSIVVKDNGVGFPDNFDYKNTDSLGLQLVNTLTDQLDGNIELNKNGFTEFKIEFKE